MSHLQNKSNISHHFLKTLLHHFYNFVNCYAIEFVEIKQNKGYYAVQGHSRSSMSVPIEILSRRPTVSKLAQIIVQILGTAFLSLPFGRHMGNVRCAS